MAKELSCDGKTGSAVTHNNPSKTLMSEITIPWKAPLFTSGPSKTVEFKFTVLKDFSTYWVKELGTNTVTITKAAEEGEAEAEVFNF